MTVTMPPMSGNQHRAWDALLDLHEAHPAGWTLVGGQMVHLHCAERDRAPNRPTDDADALLDIRSLPDALMSVTTQLKSLGFTAAGVTRTGHQHRWVRTDGATIDLLIPRHLGERASTRTGASGGTTLETPGAQQALDRTESVTVDIGGRTGIVPRPNLLGAIVAKAAAHTVTLDRARARHIADFAVLSTLVRPSDSLHTADRRDRQYLYRMLDAMRSDRRTWAGVDGAEQGLERLRLALSDNGPAERPTTGRSTGDIPLRPNGGPAGDNFTRDRRREPGTGR